MNIRKQNIPSRNSSGKWHSIVRESTQMRNMSGLGKEGCSRCYSFLYVSCISKCFLNSTCILPAAHETRVVCLYQCGEVKTLWERRGAETLEGLAKTVANGSFNPAVLGLILSPLLFLFIVMCLKFSGQVRSTPCMRSCSWVALNLTKGKISDGVRWRPIQAGGIQTGK